MSISNVYYKFIEKTVAKNIPLPKFEPYTRLISLYSCKSEDNKAHGKSKLEPGNHKTAVASYGEDDYRLGGFSVFASYCHFNIVFFLFIRIASTGGGYPFLIF